MAVTIKVDTTELDALAAKFENFNASAEIHKALKNVAEETVTQAQRATGAKTHTVTGNLKRGWNTNSIEYSDEGNVHIADVINHTQYAEYVDKGHRQKVGRYVPAIGKRLKVAWVEGRFFVDQAEGVMRRIAPLMVEEDLQKAIEEKLND